MLRLVLLSCLVSCMALGEEAAPGTNVTTSPDEPAPGTNVATSPDEPDFVPVPFVTEARGAQVATDGKSFLYHIKLNWFQALELRAQTGQRHGTFNNQAEYNQMVELMRKENAALVPAPTITEARGTQAATDKKYFLYHIKLNWFQALEFCAQMGQRLGTFNNQAEYNQMVELMRKENAGDLKANYWTAGSDNGEKDKYVWLTTGKPITYTNWYPGEPNHANECAAGCIELRAGMQYYMNDSHCSDRNYVVCEAVP